MDSALVTLIAVGIIGFVAYKIYLDVTKKDK